MSIFQVPPEVSRKKVNHAGEVLAEGSVDSTEYAEALKIAEQWRLAHLYPINTFQSRLRKMVRGMPGAIVAQRLKRMPTIINKLNRHPGMQLSRMQDIGGIRAIVKDVSSVRNLVARYESTKRFKHALKRKDDYIHTPKPDGYRGVHLVYQYSDSLARGSEAHKYKGLNIEIQIRTQEQHVWSTAVESMGTVLRQPFKTHGGDEEWAQFFALMSSVGAIVEGEPVLREHEHMSPREIYTQVAILEEKLRILDLVTGYGFAIKSTHDRHKGFYHVIELDMNDRRVHILSFDKSESRRASDKYAEREKATEGDVTKDVVLVSAGELKNLRSAYPNYFLDINKFAERVAAIIDLLEEIE